MEGKRPETCRRAPNLVGNMADLVQVSTPAGRSLRVRISALSGIETRGGSLDARRFFVRYRSGRRLEVDHDSATRVFDALSPKLFETM